MICTDKEWKYCRVEKRGCNGCYYDVIPKLKIRERIEELKKKEMCYLVNMQGFSMGIIQEQIKLLQELLEE